MSRLPDWDKRLQKYLTKSRKQPQHIRTNFSMKNMTEVFTNILSEINITEKVDLKLPTLNNSNKLTLPTLKKPGNKSGIKLPKLNKIKL